jgi:hypothetical protein
MQPNVRAVVAYISGRSVTKKNVSAVYDYDSGKYVSVAGEVSESRVNVYEYGSNCYVIGNWQKGGNSMLYHYGVGNYIQLAIQGNQFRGYDYNTGSYFQGHVSVSSVSLYDYGDSRYHNYLI